MHQAIATIPAHKSAVSDLKFFQAPPDSPSSSSESYPQTAVPRAFSNFPIFNGGVKKEEDADDVSHDAPMAVENGAGGEDKPDFPISGSFLVSSGFDGFIKVWSADDWQLVRQMSNDSQGKVMAVDVSSGTSLPLLFPIISVVVLRWLG